MSTAIKTAVDPSGRVLIPKKLRAAAAFAPGMVLDARCEEGCIVLVPAAAPVRIQRKGRFFVATPEEGRPPLTEDVVEETLRRIRRERDAEPG
jgi:bifunctional DNA-binding transcriptional regulator/antitoxin component of YhaV-PrlF toxin-antitoxin module